jgi:hypothetical protein
VRTRLLLLVVSSLLVAACTPTESKSDRPDSFDAAEKARPSTQGQWLRERLSKTDDEDWYRFDVVRAGQHLVTLGGLPANYDLELYSASGSRLDASTRSGTTYEDFYRALRPGTYYARVVAAGKTRAKGTYALQFRRLPDTVHVLTRRVRRQGRAIDVHGLLLNNTGQWRNVQQLTLLYVARSGAVLGRTSASLHVRGPVPPYRSMPFGVAAAAVPAGTASYGFEVATTITSAPAPDPRTSLEVSAPADASLPDVGRVYSGTVTNVGTAPVSGGLVFVVRYDSYGAIHDFTVATVPQLAPGRSTRYRAPMLRAKVNRVVRWAYDDVDG